MQAFKQRISITWCILAVAVLYVIAQLILFSWHRAPGWDESVYLSQIMPKAHAAFFGAFRARGVPTLAMPAGKLVGTVGAVRLSFMVYSAALLFVSFWIWAPVIGYAAPIAALMFCASWLGLLNGSEILPNIWPSLLAVATVGLVVRSLGGGSRRTTIAAASLLAVTAFFRPTEATVTSIAIGLCIVAFERRAWRILIPLGAGLLVGWLPWLIEMSVRFDGPINALKQAGTAHFAVASTGHNLVRNLAYTNGGIFPPASNQIPPAGLAWWLVIVALSLVALIRDKEHRSAMRMIGLVTVGFTLEYIVFVQALAPRYLLPAYAASSILASVGLMRLAKGRSLERVAAGIIIVALIPWSAWQMQVARRVESAQNSSYGFAQALGETIGQLAGGQTCEVWSMQGSPEIDLASGCWGQRLRGTGPTAAELQQLSQVSGRVIFLVTKGPAGVNTPLGQFAPVKVLGTHAKKWYVYELGNAPSG